MFVFIDCYNFFVVIGKKFGCKILRFGVFNFIICCKDVIKVNCLVFFVIYLVSVYLYILCVCILLIKRKDERKCYLLR